MSSGSNVLTHNHCKVVQICVWKRMGSACAIVLLDYCHCPSIHVQEYMQEYVNSPFGGLDVLAWLLKLLVELTCLQAILKFKFNWTNGFIYFICLGGTNPSTIFWPYQVTWCVLSSVAHLYFLALTVFFVVVVFFCPTKVLNQCCRVVQNQSPCHSLPDCSVYKNRQLKRWSQANKHMPLVLCKFDSLAPQGIWMKCCSALLCPRKNYMHIFFNIQILTDFTGWWSYKMDRKYKLLWLSDVFEVSPTRDGDKLVLGQTFYGENTGRFFFFLACRVRLKRNTPSHCCLKGHWASWALGNLQLSVWVITSPDLGRPGCFQILGCLPSPHRACEILHEMRW